MKDKLLKFSHHIICFGKAVKEAFREAREFDKAMERASEMFGEKMNLSDYQAKEILRRNRAEREEFEKDEREYLEVLRGIQREDFN